MVHKLDQAYEQVGHYAEAHARSDDEQEYRYSSRVSSRTQPNSPFSG